MNNTNSLTNNKSQQQLGQSASSAAAALLAKQSGAFASPNNNSLSPHQRLANNQSPLNAIGNNMVTPTNKSKLFKIILLINLSLNIISWN